MEIHKLLVAQGFVLCCAYLFLGSTITEVQWYHVLLAAVVGAQGLSVLLFWSTRLPEWEELPVEPDEIATQDYIVVGAGCAGCALTASLVNAGKRVILTEYLSKHRSN